MKISFNILIFLNILFCLFLTTHSFVPASLMEKAIQQVEKLIPFTKASITLTHEEIIKRGIIQSVVKYFYEVSNKTSFGNGFPRIDIKKIDNDYYNLKNLFYDFYGKYYCTINLQTLLITEFQPNVANIDFDKNTKDLPYAHFDAETFNQSNERVIQFKNNIFAALDNKNYKEARKLAGQISHTIQDFYSHSNWVELGYDNINLDIGDLKFANTSTIQQNDNNTCNNECTLTEVQCSSVVNLLVKFIMALKIKSSIVSCPLTYYECKNNILVNGSLISGYYSGQKLPDGTAWEKPPNLIKCSHGGILDKSSLSNAIGGINKDSGYFMFSPHADLHLRAADLAIKHTAYFFNQIRDHIGDDEYSNFLELNPKKSALNSLNQQFQICSATSIKLSKISFLFLFTIIHYFKKL